MSTEVDPETNPLRTGDDNIGYDETGEQIKMGNLNPYDSSSRRGSVDLTGHHRTDEETSFGGDISDTTALIEKERKRDAAWARIKSKFPNANTVNSSFTATIDKFNRVVK